MRRMRSALAVVCAVIPMMLCAAPTVTAAPPVVAAAPPVGSSKYVAVTPMRLADTRPTSGNFGYSTVSSDTIRVDITHRPGVPANATAAVLNVTIVGAGAWGYATVFPGGSAVPNTSSLNADGPGRVIANLVHVKVGANGAADILRSTSMNLIVDLVGVYVPVSDATKDGRLITRADGAIRVLDTRNGSSPIVAGVTTSVDVSAAGVPVTASAVVVNITAVDAAGGFWSAFPSDQGFPGTSTLNLDAAHQTRAAQAIVNLAGSRSFDVFTENGGHLLVDVVGYFTGESEPTAATDGLFVPASPLRVLDTRSTHSLPPWSGSTFEFLAGNPANIQAAAAVLNITATSPWDLGFVTAYPAGVSRPNASNLNVSAWPQTIANHAIVRISNRGAALFTQGGAQLIADVAGWYLGLPTAATQITPGNPAFTPNAAVAVAVPRLGIFVGIRTGSNLNRIADQGFAATWSDINRVAAPGNVMLFAHRTAGAAPFRYINLLNPGDGFSLIGSDGHSYNYVVVDRGVSTPIYSLIQSYAKSYGQITAQLVACSRIDGSATSLSYRIVVTGRLVSVT